MKSDPKNDLFGLILTGGQSIRMGTDKSLISYHGIPQKDYLFDLLSPFCQSVHTSVASDAQLNNFTNPVPDAFELKSPLNGILTAFQIQPDACWITVPIDMPYVNKDTIRFLVDHRETSKIATCFFDSDHKFPEPLLTIWEPRSRATLLDFYNQGKTSPRDFLMQSEVNLLRAPDLRWLQNVNTPSELDTFRKSQRKK